MGKPLQDTDSARCHSTVLIVQAMLLTQLLHFLLDLAKVVSWQCWEKVMLNLVVQATCSTVQ